MKKTEHRNYNLILYANSINEIENVCKSVNNILYYAIIMHDKDAGKELHYHLVLILRSARAYTTVQNYFNFTVNGVKQNTFIEICSSLLKSFEYLTHKNDLDKYQYNEEDIICNDKKQFLVNITDKDNTLAILQDLEQNKCLRDMAKIYGKELIYKYKQFKDFLNDMLYQEEIQRTNDKVNDFIDTNIDELEII